MDTKNERSKTSRVRLRWIAAAAIAALVVGALLLHTPTPSTDPAQHSGESSRGSSIAAPLRANSTANLTQESLDTKPAAIVVLSAASKGGEIEICGIGTVKINADDPEAVTRYTDAAIKETREHWRSALLASDDYRARAVGLFLESSGAGSDDAKLSNKQPLVDLVQLAVGTRDPAVYSIALHKCRAYMDTPMADVCQQISLREWARIDSDNAVPWLQLAGLAQTNKDTLAEADAFSHVIKAQKSDTYGNSLYAFAQPELPSDFIPAKRVMLAVEMIGYQAALVESRYTVALRYCSVDALKENQVRQECNALAELWAKKGTTIMDIGIGAKIGERVGWSKDRLEPLLQERDAMWQVLSTSLDGADSLSCKNVQRYDDYLAQLTNRGEAGALRDAIARSGESVQDLARRHVVAIEEAKRTAEKQ